MKIEWEDWEWCWAGFAGETWIASVYKRGDRLRWDVHALQGARHSFAKAGTRKSVTDAKRACQKSWDRFFNECGLTAKETA